MNQKNQKMTEQIQIPNFRIPWKQDIWEQVHKKNEDCIIAIIGKRRKGKSVTGLGLCHSMDPEGFTPENIHERVFMYPMKFMEWAQKPKKDLYRGLSIMFDEVGVGIPSREWQSFNNKAINKVMQIFGHKGFFAIFTLPHLGFMDKGPRSMVDYLIEVLKIDRHKKLNVCKVKELVVHPITGDYKTPFLKYKIDGQWMKFSLPYRFKRPPLKLVKAYLRLQEDYKQEFEEKMYEEAKTLHSEIVDRRRKKNLNEEELINKVVQNKEDYARMRGGRWVVDPSLIQYEFKIGRVIAERIKKIAENKINREMPL